jgi:hypothetical protein
MLGDLVWFNEPLNARPMPVLAVETMTASLMVFLCVTVFESV